MSQQAPDPDYLECFTDEADDSSHLRNLLAIIHGDGGHHTEAVGTAQSCRDAAAKWYRLGNDVEPAQRLCGYNGCTEPAYRCEDCDAEGCMDALRKACRCENGPDEVPVYTTAPRDVAELEQLVKGNAAPPTVQPKQLQTFDHLFEGLLPEEEDP
ncbi:MAG: hypothetical protein E6Q97_01625 [Desulfurellales bacterium]|nr:MAG: hypothetical protein E6Q97_01625 [Desulfurellales bacterium]